MAQPAQGFGPAEGLGRKVSRKEPAGPLPASSGVPRDESADGASKTDYGDQKLVRKLHYTRVTARSTPSGGPSPGCVLRAAPADRTPIAPALSARPD